MSPMYSRILGATCAVPSRLPSATSRDPAGLERLVPAEKDGRSEEPFVAAWIRPKDAAALAALAPPVVESWSAHAQRPPIEQRVADAAEATPLDEAIDRNLQHLEAVFRRPRLTLRTTQERVPLAQARRVPERATEALVSHPEDWERRKATSIEPLRVLAQFSEDDLDLYENRIAVRLLDGLLVYVVHRIEDVRKRLSMVQEGAECVSSDGAARGGHWRNMRVFELFGKYFDPESSGSRQLLADRLSHLEAVRSRLLRYQDRPLYGAVDQRAARALGQAMQPTNILVNDAEYRKVAELWRAWVAQVSDDEGDEARLRRRQRESASFDRFVRILAVRALCALGWTTSATDPLVAGARIALHRKGRDITLHCHRDGTLEIACGPRRLRIAPVLCGLTADNLTAVESDLANHCQDRPSDLDLCVVLLGGPAGSADAATTNPRTHSPMLAGWGNPTTILVSPLELDSQERLGRALNIWLTTHGVLEFGCLLPAPSLPGLVLPSWLQSTQRSGRKVVVAVRPPSPGEAATFRAQARDLQRHAARSAPSKTPDQAAARKIDEAIEQVIAAAEGLSELRTCPLCNDPGEWEPRIDSQPWTWWCRCANCASEWGTRACGGCRRPYPVLRPGNVDAPPSEYRAHDWRDLTFGRDLWSVPCADADRWGLFRCSHCGSCGDVRGGCAAEY
jgi:hypothetical protein